MVPVGSKSLLKAYCRISTSDDHLFEHTAITDRISDPVGNVGGNRIVDDWTFITVAMNTEDTLELPLASSGDVAHQRSACIVLEVENRVL